eukprot:TRINITY_DN9373_c1_g2_i6.p1 TRINITY_DN9373_c1_g2~~TRINITY_DN9373_c1_g2_i6.p1  ORF type:complete len:259 (+),score=34.37 TRINITY_DN9373_c1_g2_i6:75-851(+)
MASTVPPALARQTKRFARHPSLREIENESRPILAKPNRKLFFGLGNWFYPRSRVSVGIWVLEAWARKHNLTWESYDDHLIGTAENEDYLLMKPQTYYVGLNGRSWLSGVDYYKMSYDRCVVVHHDEKRPFGDIELHFGGRIEYNEALLSLFEVTGTERFPRLSIGVAPPKAKEMQGRYLPTFNFSDCHYTENRLLTKFPKREMELVEHVLFPEIFKMIEHATALTKAEDYNLRYTKSYEEIEEIYKNLLKNVDFLKTE